MAYLIPENLRARRDVAPGVARFAAALRDGLDDDVTVWYEPMFDPGGERPDLVILLPHAGVLVIEVLESRSTALRGVREGRLVIADDGQDREMATPLARANAFAEHLRFRISNEPRLSPDERLPVGAAAVLPYLSRDAAMSLNLDDAIALDHCLYRDDVEAGVSASTDFRRHIARLLAPTGRDPLSETAERVYRAIIHPDSIIGSGQLPFPTVTGGRAEDDLMVLDRKQEALAKTLGVGHRVIRGSAGSGKTLVLIYRARLLAENFPDHRVLVTCFNRSLAGRLRHQLSQWPNITVIHLDSLMSQARRAAGTDPADYTTVSRDELAERARMALSDRPGSVERYHHVLIDEAQDFPTPALQFAVGLLREGADSLLAVADPVQNIFRTRFTWKAAGINAVGRTKWLDQSYRNTREILEFAHNFVMAGGDFEVQSDPDPDDERAVTAPRFSPRSGPLPVVLSSPSRQGEVVNLALHCRRLLERGVEAADISVLYGITWTEGFNWPEALRAAFAQEQIPLFWANDPAEPNNKDHIGEDRTKVLLCTIHSAKGLEFRHVLLCGYLDDKPPEQSRVSRSLIYVGMTRATHELVLSASGHHPYLADFERA
ncbi:MAG TPA: 3'-5' exonuclease [Acidimicrobiales bacterium]|nr:3'-5' exonuclease [Acidimicrobiales bacterium]